MRLRRKTICTVLAGLLALLFVGDMEPALGKQAGFRIVRGEGSICAAGHGIIQFHGSGTLVARVRMGQLILNDESAVVEIHGKGIKHRFPDGWVLYQGFNGWVRLEGESLFGQVVGKGLGVKARGEGVLMMMGRGVYRSPCDGVDVPWEFFQEDGVGVELGAYISESEEIAE